MLDGGRVTGIDYLKAGQPTTASCAGEIVLAGGAVNSPQLLQLSGIGPAEHLQSLGIEVRHAMEGVGRDLQDHLQVRSLYRLNRPISVSNDVNNLLRWMLVGIDFALRSRGPLTFSAGSVCIFTKILPESATPDLQFHFIPFSADKPGTGLHP